MRKLNPNTIYQNIPKFRLPIIIATFLLTLFFAFSVLIHPRIIFDPNIASLIPSKVATNSIVSNREDTDFLVVSIKQNEGGAPLFSPTVLNEIQFAIKEISKIENFQIAISPFEQLKIKPIHVEGKPPTYATLPILKRSNNAEIPYFFADQQTADQFKEDLTNNPIARRLVVSESGDRIAFMIDHHSYPLSMNIPRLVREILDNHTDTFSYNLAGLSYFEEIVAEFLLSDLSLLMGFGLLLILIIFYFSFQSLRAVILPILTATVSSIWMLGTVSWLGIRLSVISIVCPPLVLALSSSYSIHLLNQYYRQDYTQVPANLSPVFFSTAKIGKTITFATFTTVLSLSSLFVSKITQTHDFAVVTSVGIIYSALISLIVIPCILSYLPLPLPKKRTIQQEGTSSRAFNYISRQLIKFRYLILLFFLLTVFSPIISQHFMVYDSDYITYFPRNSKVVSDTADISKRFSGVYQIYIDYEIDKKKLATYIKENNLDLEKDFKKMSSFYHNYDLLTLIANKEQELKNDKFIPYLTSFPTLLCYANQISEGSYEIPKELAQRIKMSHIFSFLKSQNMAQFELISPDATRISTVFRIADFDIYHGCITEEDFYKILPTWKKIIKDALPPYVNFNFDGYRIGILDLRGQMNKDLTLSTLFAIFAIFITVAISMQSISYGLHALIPTIIGITLNFTIMAIFRIPLDMTTLMVTSVIIGVGVDDAIHFLLTYKNVYSKASKELPPAEALHCAIRQTLEKTGRPILLTSMAIIFGMSAMLFSSFKPITFFGFLIALALFSATLGSLFFLPMTLTLHHNIKHYIINKRKKNAKETL